MTAQSEGASPATPRQMRRVAFASCTGTTIEFYDFFVYGTAAALVFPKVFFPSLEDAAGTVASFATFGVAFLARPLGAILFGHFGDRIGRKRTLITTLLLMGLATVLIGLLPDSATIGVAAPIILVVLRIMQGLAVGGEWAGATLLMAENSPPEKRGHYGMYPQLGPPIAFALASGTFLLTNLTLGDADATFLNYGWRIPFVASILLVGIGLYVRLRVEETPVFMAEKQRRQGSQATPLLEAVKRQPREVLLAGGSLTMLFTFFYMGTAFLSSYGTKSIGLSRPEVLTTGIIASVVMALAIVVSAIYSDRVGRRKVILLSCALAVPWSLVLFPILDAGSVVVFGIALSVTFVIFGISYGPAGSALPEMFETRYRYTGAGMGYNLAGVLGGGIAPLVAAELGASFGGFAIGLLLAGLSVFSLICTYALVETRQRSMVTREPEPA